MKSPNAPTLSRDEQERLTYTEQPQVVYASIEGQHYIPRAIAVDHNGLTVGQWKTGLYSCCDACVPNCTCFSR